MNRVHEQCPKIDSGTVPSQTGPKPGRVHQVHSPGQPARPAPRPRACRSIAASPERRCRAPAAPSRPTPRANMPPAHPARAQRPTTLCSMGSSPFQVLHIYIYIYIYCHFFQPLENTKKKYLFIFFHFLVHQ